MQHGARTRPILGRARRGLLVTALLGGTLAGLGATARPAAAAVDPSDPDSGFSGTGTHDEDVRLVRAGLPVTDAVSSPAGTYVVTTSSNDLVVARLTTGGVLDTTWGGDGAVVVKNLAGNAFVGEPSIAIDSDNKPVVAIGVDGSIVVARFNSCSVSPPPGCVVGSLDTSFAGDGTALVNLGPSSNESVGGVAVDAQRRPVVAAHDGTGTVIVRFLATGAGLDTGYGLSGKASIAGVQATDAAGPLVVLPSNQVYGVASNGDGTTGVVYAIDQNGALVSGFSGDGVATHDADDDLGRRAIAIDGSNRVYVDGFVGSSTTIERYTPSGILDTTFDGDGILPVAFGTDVRALGIVGTNVVAFGDVNGSATLRRASLTGVLDTTFGAVAVGDVGDLAIKVIPDGTSLRAVTDVRAHKRLATGAADTTYGQAGAAEALPLAGSDDTVLASGPRPGGGTLIVLDAQGEPGVLALGTNGLPDNTFGDSGVAFPFAALDASLVPTVEVAEVGSDGSITLAGYTGVGEEVLRLTSAGVLDTSFGGGDGRVTVPGGSNLFAAMVHRRTDGKIVLVGTNYPGSAAGTPQQYRFTSAGVADTSFGGGDGALDLPGFSGLATTADVRTDAALALDDGTLLLGARVDGATTLKRYTDPGALDTSFDGDGSLPLATRDNATQAETTVEQIVRQASDGKIFILSARCTVDDDGTCTGRVSVTRTSSTGVLDATFGRNGVADVLAVVIEDFAPRASMLLRTDGRLVVLAGDTVAMLRGNGRPDPAFSSDGQRSYAGLAGPSAIFQQADGKLLIAGITNVNSPDPFDSGIDVRAMRLLGTSVAPTIDRIRVLDKVRTSQIPLTGSNGTDWTVMDATNLGGTFTTPAIGGTLLLTANADLWTATAGLNQDLAIFVNGSLVAWKESGGFAGTFSPNAATVFAAIPVSPSSQYTVQLRWKTNKPAGGGTIYAGAGNPGDFSPTRLLADFVPSTVHAITSATINAQKFLENSNGATWQVLDAGLATTVTPASDTVSRVFANVDLWTANGGYNQDLGVEVTASDGSYDHAIVAWKESGGFAGTFSPNAAAIATDLPMKGGVSYDLRLMWKTNKSAPAGVRIYAGAGNPGSFSPSTLIVDLANPAHAEVRGVSTRTQYNLDGSNGSTWTALDPGNLTLTVRPDTTGPLLLTASADLWTAAAGYNQDLGIFVNGSSTPVAWKESGGFAGTFSPNAASVSATFQATAGQVYTVSLGWKTNRAAPGGSKIYIGAGNPGAFSPTTLTATVLNGPLALS